MKDLKIMKTIKGRIKLVAATASLVTGLSFIGCEATVTPDGQVVVDGQVVTQLPDTTDPVEPEVVEPEVVEPEEVDPEVLEHGPRPEFILLDENGDYYEPQHVTLDDIDKRIEEATEKYNGFKSDWDRDRFVGYLIYFNGPYMDHEDISTLYDDYLANFGFNNFDAERSVYIRKGDQYRTKFDLEDLFIDERLSEEARRYYNWYYINRNREELPTYYKNEIHPKVDYSNKNFYNTALEYLMQEMVFDIGYDEMAEYNENASTTIDCLLWMFDEIGKKYPDVLEYDINNYVSSHTEEKEITR